MTYSSIRSRYDIFSPLIRTERKHECVLEPVQQLRFNAVHSLCNEDLTIARNPYQECRTSSQSLWSTRPSMEIHLMTAALNENLKAQASHYSTVSLWSAFWSIKEGNKKRGLI